MKHRRISFWATILLLLVIAGLLAVGFDAIQILFVGLSKVTWNSTANMVGVAVIAIIIICCVGASSKSQKRLPYFGISLTVVVAWIAILVLAETGISSGVAESMAEFELKHETAFQNMKAAAILAVVFVAGMLYANYFCPRVKVETREVTKRIRVNKKFWVLVSDNQVEDVVSFPSDSTNPIADSTPEEFEVKAVDENGNIISME